MYPSSRLPTPLSHTNCYILLALSRHELHAYPLRNMVINDSLGSIEAKPGRFYPTLKKLVQDGLIQETGFKPTGKSPQNRLHYAVTPEGLDHLKQDLKRLKHAVAIGENAGHFNDEIPLDIQKLLRQLA